jgi:mono/diheme cytochrome c family protein
VTLVQALIGLLILGMSAAASQSQAQDLQQGRQLAHDACASCHAVDAGDTRSPVSEAPAFAGIARTPGMTAAALTVWLTAHPHPTMPLIKLSHEQVQDVAAYILSLRD